MPTGSLPFDGRPHAIVDLPALFGDALQRLPAVLRLLLENVVRNMRGVEREAAVSALLARAERGTSEAEIAFQPGRVPMHDTTGTPALVDIAAMRNALAEAGIDPSVLNLVLPMDVSVDRSLAVEAFGRPDAPEINLQHEVRRDAERYRFLRWASRALDGVRINPPGTGIMHTINLEQLATVVTTEQAEGAALGRDVDGAGLACRGRLPEARGADRRPVGGGLRHRRLRVHHLHRQPRTAARADRRGDG